jgi:hypothetical protein
MADYMKAGHATSDPWRYVLACAWAGPVLLVATLLFWAVLGQNVPPYSAGLSADAMAEQVRANATLIRIGMVGQMTVSGLYLVWGVAISKVMEQMEGDNNVLSTIQLWGAGFTVLVFEIPCMAWLAASFRADVLPAPIIQALYDMGWMFFDIAYLTSLQMIPLAICIINDRRDLPLMPKWVGWFSLWVAISFLLLILTGFFKTGPFARDGLLNYWVEFSLFFWFWILIAFYTIKAVRRLEREHEKRSASA